VQNKQCHSLIHEEHLDERKDLTERLEEVETKLDLEVKHENVFKIKLIPGSCSEKRIDGKEF
jgi:hypothetical protein